MIEVRIPDEITDYKEKIVLGLSLKQLVCLCIAAIVAVPLYLLLMNISMEVAFYAVMIVSVPIVCMGFVRPDGLNFEVWLRIKATAFLRKSKLGYETDEGANLPIEAEAFRAGLQKFYREKENLRKLENPQQSIRDKIKCFINNLRIKNKRNSNNGEEDTNFGTKGKIKKSKIGKTEYTACRETDFVEVGEKSIKRKRKATTKALKATAGKNRKTKSKKKKAA